MNIVSAKKKIVDKLVVECTENIDEVKIAEENVCVCFTQFCIIFSVTALAISIVVGAYFAYSHWHKDVSRIKFGTRTQWNCAFFKIKFILKNLIQT